MRVGNSGAMALEMCLSNNPPDLVLLDIMMPGIDGFEVARRMREHPASQTIPVIFVTAMTEKAVSLKGFDLSAVDFVTKPIDPGTLKPSPGVANPRNSSTIVTTAGKAVRSTPSHRLSPLTA